jgi:hypothetical protein
MYNKELQEQSDDFDSSEDSIPLEEFVQVWSGKDKENYFDDIEENREILMKKVRDWYERISETLRFILPLFAHAMNNINLKISNLGDAWVTTKENIERVYENEQMVSKTLKVYNPVVSYNDIFRPPKEKEKRDELDNFMIEILPLFIEHKKEQTNLLLSSVQRMESEIMNPLRKKLKDIKEIEFEKSNEIHRKAHKWLNTVKEKLEKKKKAYGRFMDIASDNQTAAIRQKRPKSDTLNSLIMLSIHVGDLFNSLTEIEKMIIEIWDLYKHMVKNTKLSLLGYYNALNEIIPEYFFPDKKNKRNQEYLENLEEDQLNKITTILKETQIEIIKKAFEKQADFSFDDLCLYYRSEMEENFESYIGKSWNLEDKKTHQIYWITFSEDLFLNVYQVEEINGRLQTIGTALISDYIEKVKFVHNQQKCTVSFKGARPGAFFSKTVKIQMETMNEIDHIQEVINSAKNFISEFNIN